MVYAGHLTLYSNVSKVFSLNLVENTNVVIPHQYGVNMQLAFDYCLCLRANGLDEMATYSSMVMPVNSLASCFLVLRRLIQELPRFICVILSIYLSIYTYIYII